MNLKLSPVPKAIHSSEMLRRSTDAMESTITSVSTVRIDTLLNPSGTASCTCRRILVSASSCVHGDISEMSWRLQGTLVPCVVIIILLVSICTTSKTKKEKKLGLVVINVKKLLKISRNAIEGSTRRFTTLVVG